MLALVEQYQLRHPDERKVEWIDEAAFLALQKADGFLGPMINEVMTSGQMDENGIHRIDQAIGSYQMHSDGKQALRFISDRTVTHNDLTIKQRVNCLFVPKIAIPALLERYHDRYGHPGHDRMYRTIQTKYYWPGMHKDVHVSADGCLYCQQRKRIHSKRMPLMSFPSCDRPFERCHIDLSGPFVTTKRNMKYILVFKDYLTKWVEIFALPDKSEFAVAECFVDEIILRHGAPSALMSDQGTEFVNKVMDQISVLLRIRRITTSPYHPRADGLAENMVGVMKDSLAAYVNVFQTDWDDHLAVVAHYYRTTVNTTTGFTPYFMLYGRECRQPDELWVKSFSELAETSDILVTDYVRGLSESMLLVWELIGAQLKDQVRARNERINQHIKHIQHFQPGDLVWLERPPQSVFVSQDDNERHKISKSLRLKFCGPYEVVKKISPITYILNVGGKTQHHTIDRMKPYKQRKHNKQAPNEDTAVGTGEIPQTDGSSVTNEQVEQPVTLERKKRGRKKKKVEQQMAQQIAQVSSVQVFRVRTISLQYDLQHVVKDVISTMEKSKKDSRKPANGGEKGGS